MIKNKNRLIHKSSLRKKALEIIDAGYKAISVEKIIKDKVLIKNGHKLVIKNVDNRVVLNIDLKSRKNIYLIGIGKNSYSAIFCIYKILEKFVDTAVAIDIAGFITPKVEDNKVKVFYGTHPEPSEKNIKLTNKILDIVKKTSKDDLIIYFIGGGGSSLLCGTQSEYIYGMKIFSELTKKGAPIEDLNIVRKHLSVVKGGWMAKYSYPAKFISLIVSDVPKDDISVIASGPTVFDKSTIIDAKKILKKYKIKSSVIKFIETPKDKKYFRNSKNILIANKKNALESMFKQAKKFKLNPKILSSSYSGEARDMLPKFIKKIKPGEVLLIGGETTVTLSKNPGKGGRNLEATLSVLNSAYNAEIVLTNIFASSVASDGYDFVPVAGGIADSVAMERIVKLGVEPEEYLKRNDSYTFFKKIGGIIEVERKAFNVSDLAIILREK